MSETLKHKIKELVTPLLQEKKMFLVDMSVHGSKLTTITIYVDSEFDGVNVDECSEISRELEFLMDAHNMIDSPYRLDISSPGLSRPLSDYRQYKKNKGRRAKIKYKQNGEYNKLEGKLAEIDEQKILVTLDEGISQTIPFKQIVETKIVPVI